MRSEGRSPGRCGSAKVLAVTRGGWRFRLNPDLRREAHGAVSFFTARFW